MLARASDSIISSASGSLLIERKQPSVRRAFFDMPRNHATRCVLGVDKTIGTPPYARARTYPSSSRSQSGMWKPAASSFASERAECTGRGATGPSAFA